MPFTQETVEYNLAKQLLIIRNPTRPLAEEASLLAANDWSPLSDEEILAVLSPTPTSHRQFMQNFGDLDNVVADSDKEAEDTPAVQGTIKHVYRPTSRERNSKEDKIAEMSVYTRR